MTKYEELRKRINKHCPYLLELKFGCELLGEDGTVLFLDPYMMTYSLEEKPHILGRNEHEFIHFQTKEILGIPPTLADVLRALDGKDIGNVGGTFVKITFDNWETLNVEYDLTLPLSDQSEETLDFLLSVIE